MKLFRIALCASIAVCSASAAWAQYGLYGAPEPLRVPQQNVAPTYTAPTYAAPTYVAPGYATPTYTAPTYAAPTYVAPGYATPTYAAPGYTAPSYAAPSYTAPASYPSTYYPAASAYPSTSAPMVQPPPRPAYYQPAPSYSPYPPPQYRYTAQPPATAMYQPYQPGSQYRYPSPYSRPPVQMMASAGSGASAQPIPAPAVVPASPAPVPSPVPAADYGPPVDPSAPQGPGVMNQMLGEQAYYGGCGPCEPYRGAVERFERAACNPGYDAGGCDGGQQGCCGPWYASVSALVMGRSDAPRVWTSYRDLHNETQLMNTQFGLQWTWGGEVCVGRRFCCDCVPYALEATFWTTEAFTGTECATWPGGHVSTPLIVKYIDFNGENAEDWFDGAEEHRLTRRDEFYNLEINLIREQLAWACDSPWDIGWSVGVRYFRFQEDLDFSTRRQGCEWTDLDGVACLNESVTNNLVGLQFGFDAAYCLCNGVRFFIKPSVGIYDNFMDSTFQCHTGDMIPGHTDDYGCFPACGTKNGLAFLTQVDVGVDWHMSRCWSAKVGYRVVAITGMALADSQFPQYINDIPDIQNVQHTDSLVLHGAFVGVTYNF